MAASLQAAYSLVAMPGSKFHIRWVRSVFGLILLIAALLKLQYWFEGPREAAFTAYSLFVPGVAGAETLMALWLFTGIWPRGSLLVATGAFGCFAGVSLWKIFHGVEVCGCFGKWSPSPKVIYWIDVAAFCFGIRALRLSFARTGSAGEGTPGGSRIFRLLLPGTLALSLGFYGVALVHGRTIEATPERWLDGPWPPPGALNVPADLGRGRWIVLIYGSACGHCQSMAADYADMDHDWQSHGKKTRVALIDADADQGLEKPWARPGLIEGSLLQPDQYRNTPIVLLVVDGRVRAVREGWDEIDWSIPPYSGWIR